MSASPKKSAASEEAVLLSSDEGEIVERDGAPVVKVRKRKRRSSQKKNEVIDENRRRVFKLILTVSVLTVVLVLSVALSLMYVNSRAFAKKVELTINSTLSVKSALSGLSVSPSEITASSVDIQGTSDDVLKSLYFESLAGDHRLYGLFGGSWIGEEIVAQKGHGSLLLDRKSPSSSGTIPLEHSYSALRCKSFNLVLPIGSREISLKGSEAAYVGSEVRFRGGELVHPWLGKATITDIDYTSASSKLTVDFDLGDGALFSYSGELEDTILAGIGKLGPIKLTKFLPNIDSLVRGSFVIANADIKGRIDHFSIEGDFEAKELVLNIAGVNEVIRLAGLSSRKGMISSEKSVTGHLSVSPKGLEMTDIVIRNEDYTVEGKIAIRGDSLQGKLRISLPPSHKELIVKDSKLVKLFKLDPRGSGSYQTFINIGGTVAEPVDDLESRLHGAQFGDMSPSQREFLEQQLRSIIEE